MIRTDFTEILRILLAHQVDFVLVGALSAVLQGAPVMTVDVAIVHARSLSNIRALLAALDELDAKFRGHSGRELRPTAEHLASAGHQLLSTNLGPLDLLGAIEFGLDYEALIADTIEIPLDTGHIRTLTLARYVQLKEQSTRSKDLARLPILRETLALLPNATKGSEVQGREDE